MSVLAAFTIAAGAFIFGVLVGYVARDWESRRP